MLQSKAYNRPTYQNLKPSFDKIVIVPEETEIGDWVNKLKAFENMLEFSDTLWKT